MDLRADASVSFPLDVVFVAYRDRLVETTEHLPNIRAIKVLSREERGPDVALVNEWTGGGDIPSVARAFLSESMLKWTDHALWKAASHEVDWRTEVHAFPGAVSSSGTNRFFDAGSGATRIEIRGDFVVDAAKVPGVPRLLARSVGPAIEKFFVHQIQLNAIAVAKAVGKLIAASG
ncbi:MAG TPA: DUF2505 family protein [Minicystis sp.]|nr:DUF2505 family protein [Minicystis sp.]